MTKATGLISFLLLSIAVAVPAASADTIVNFGYAAFNMDDPIAGQESFSIDNFTGPAFGCSVDFQICDNVSVLTALLTIGYTDNGGIVNYFSRALVSPVMPGTTTPYNFIFDANTVHIFAADLTGTVAAGPYTLDDASLFTPATAFKTSIDVSGTTIGLIQLNSADVNPVPEPASWLLLLGALPVLRLARRHSL